MLADSLKSQADTKKINDITSRLYKHKKKDAEVIEQNKKYIKDKKERPKSAVFKVFSSNKR